MSNVFDVKFKMGAIHKVNKLMSNNVYTMCATICNNLQQFATICNNLCNNVCNNVCKNVCNSVYNNEQRCATMCAIYTVQFTKANKLMSNTVIPSNANSNASTAERHR